MPKVYVLSVPHMGTHWTVGLLRAWGFEVEQQHCLTVGHRWIDEGHRVVVPWRDPVLALISEANREDRHRWAATYPRVTARKVVTVGSLSGENVFRLSVPPSSHQLAQLAAFLEVSQGPVDLAPVNCSGDRTGLKARFFAGHDDFPDFNFALQVVEPGPCDELCCEVAA